MPNVDTLKQHRLSLLSAIYEESGGNRRAMIDPFKLGEGLGLSYEDVEIAVQYLEGECLVETATMEGLVFLTHQGVREIEEARSHPDQSTTYFPPMQTIINNFGQISNSQIQQGGQGNVQTGNWNSGAIDLDALAKKLRQDFEGLQLSPAAEEDVSLYLQTLDLQAKASAPKSTIVRSVLDSLRELATAAGGEMLATYISAKLGLLR